jgi:hypothetical protein
MLSFDQRQAIWARECCEGVLNPETAIFGPSFLDWVLALPTGEPPASVLFLGESRLEWIRAETMPSPWDESHTAERGPDLEDSSANVFCEVTSNAPAPTPVGPISAS